METAACGLDCDSCGSRGADCDGCHSDTGKLWSPDCPIRICCISKRHHLNCSRCESFPCSHTTNFENDPYPHHSAAIENLREMKKSRE